MVVQLDPSPLEEAGCRPIAPFPPLPEFRATRLGFSPQLREALMNQRCSSASVLVDRSAFGVAEAALQRDADSRRENLAQPVRFERLLARVLGQVLVQAPGRAAELAQVPVPPQRIQEQQLQSPEPELPARQRQAPQRRAPQRQVRWLEAQQQARGSLCERLEQEQLAARQTLAARTPPPQALVPEPVREPGAELAERAQGDLALPQRPQKRRRQPQNQRLGNQQRQGRRFGLADRER